MFSVRTAGPDKLYSILPLYMGRYLLCTLVPFFRFAFGLARLVVDLVRGGFWLGTCLHTKAVIFCRVYSVAARAGRKRAITIYGFSIIYGFVLTKTKTV